MESTYHVPVMVEETIRYLIQKPDGIYLDGTIGGGGHAKHILSKLSKKALLIGIDRDPDAIEMARVTLKEYQNFRVFHGTYDKIADALKENSVTQIDGILLDLGVSSWQINQDNRGFSFRPGLKLDMRMNASQDETAAGILERFSEQELKRIFKEYGEERFSGRIARKVIKSRSVKKLEKSNDLLEIINQCVNPRYAVKSYARIWQALRIAVNNELDILNDALINAVKYMSLNARICVITYHSLEDRIVKNFFRDNENPCTCPPGLPICSCGKKAKLKRLKPTFIIPSDQEIKDNSRARSAKLRVATKV